MNKEILNADYGPTPYTDAALRRCQMEERQKTKTEKRVMSELLEACKWALAQRNYSEVAYAVEKQGGNHYNTGVWLALEKAIEKAEKLLKKGEKT